MLTVQEGISLNQFNKMRAHGVRLVLPGNIINKYNADICSEIMSLEGFLGEVRTLTKC
ncbi:MAG: hypothetical protein K9I59_09640 [Chlorobium sp.]|uniref:type II restriction endonuclease n=1 Tax=Chlorobium sp. TaxID=1095 RepID=UPI0029F1A7C1|nr:hypothetical protein [Chlorobium sp.]MCF8271928.1 hypothetical protein [Chlorobium sp.]MCF8288299.1 hypothetical protein [Chlorobium sp.]MCF8291891.1 hypothetical protein [Chlorobium sp.]MCF8385998.1 hypothetical protein [Chlorobium sp.]